MGQVTRLVQRPQAYIVDEVHRNPLGRERPKEGECRVAGADASRLPVGFLNFFLCKPEPIGSSRFNRREAGKVDLNDEQKLRYNG